MSRSIIDANPKDVRKLPDVFEEDKFLEVAEFFCDTIQGENFVGYPAAFLRLQYCTMDCHWCDTNEVWRFGNPYNFEELFDLMDKADLPHLLKEGQHLVLTGGSPLKQQHRLVRFLEQFELVYGFHPFIEIENECTILPLDRIVNLIDCWNNSPKLKNSGNLAVIRYQPTILAQLSTYQNSWFKFVITDPLNDWAEIMRDFIEPGLIRKNQIVLMPEGMTRKRLELNRQGVVDLAIRENVRYSSREHVELWDRATGV